MNAFVPDLAMVLELSVGFFLVMHIPECGSSWGCRLVVDRVQRIGCVADELVEEAPLLVT